jgi:hypothetical protein
MRILALPRARFTREFFSAALLVFNPWVSIHYLIGRVVCGRFGPSVTVPLFTGGRNRAQLAVARAVSDETIANYRPDGFERFSGSGGSTGGAESFSDATGRLRTALSWQRGVRLKLRTTATKPGWSLISK